MTFFDWFWTTYYTMTFLWWFWTTYYTMTFLDYILYLFWTTYYDFFVDIVWLILDDILYLWHFCLNILDDHTILETRLLGDSFRRPLTGTRSHIFVWFSTTVPYTLCHFFDTFWTTYYTMTFFVQILEDILYYDIFHSFWTTYYTMTFLTDFGRHAILWLFWPTCYTMTFLTDFGRHTILWLFWLILVDILYTLIFLTDFGWHTILWDFWMILDNILYYDFLGDFGRHTTVRLFWVVMDDIV